jgi:hypothetical protein
MVFLTACGYKPTSIYTKKVLGASIYVKVETSLEDPENSILIRDALNEAVIYKFNAKTTAKEQATAQLYVKLEHVGFQPIEYDNNGYVIAYKTNVTLLTRYHDRYGKENSLRTEGDFDFNIASNSVISDTKRFNAIKEASQKAIDAFISRISVEGVNYDH